MTKTLFIFPGQGAQYPGMGHDLFKDHDAVRRTYEEANDILGYNIAETSFRDPEEKLMLTRYTQPALFLEPQAATPSRLVRIFPSAHLAFGPVQEQWKSPDCRRQRGQSILQGCDRLQHPAENARLPAPRIGASRKPNESTVQAGCNGLA